MGKFLIFLNQRCSAMFIIKVPRRRGDMEEMSRVNAASAMSHRLAIIVVRPGLAPPASARCEDASMSMKPPIDSVIDKAAAKKAKRINGALRLYS